MQIIRAECILYYAHDDLTGKDMLVGISLSNPVPIEPLTLVNTNDYQPDTVADL